MNRLGDKAREERRQGNGSSVTAAKQGDTPPQEVCPLILKDDISPREVCSPHLERWHSSAGGILPCLEGWTGSGVFNKHTSPEKDSRL